MQVDIQTLGADAARQGLTLLDYPYLGTAAMPAHTGESVNEWRSRVEMWKAGSDPASSAARLHPPSWAYAGSDCLRCVSR